MAITPEELYKMTLEQEQRVSELEKHVEDTIRDVFLPDKDEIEVPLPFQPDPLEEYYLEQIYIKAGWKLPMVEQYEDGTASLILKNKKPKDHKDRYS